MKLLILWAVIALTASAHARSTAKQQQVTPHITSLSDKDARLKARTHPAFASAGQRAGLELWRIENFDPVAVPQKDVGKFYKGDSYIVLKTTSDKRNNLSWDIHYWIGSETSQDEAGAAAILTVGLDDKFDGKAVQHRESMGYESAQFLGYFPGGAVRYVDGGHQSGFNHVVTNPGAEKRLFQVKGKKNIRVRQVDPLISSMNKGDCFILDINNDILVYVGEKAKNVEKLKATSMANQIRDQDHNGRGKVETIDQYSSESDVQKFFTYLGSGSKDLVPEESAGGDDQTFEKNEEKSVILSEVSDSSGKLKITPLTAPFRQEQLKPQETYILDTVSGSIYVWVGKQATQKEKTEAMAKAEQYLSSKNYPSWVHVARIPQGTEPAIFKQYFTTWRDVGMSHSRLVRAVDDAYLQKLEPSVKHLYEVKKGSNNMYIKEMDDIKQVNLEEDGTYILQNGENTFVWFGKETPITSVKLWEDIIVQFLSYFPQENTQTFKVAKQGLEPDNFIRAFQKWDPYMWQKQNSYEMNREEVLRFNEIEDSK
ncbi:actin depolymerising venom protein gelsolin 1-like [Vanessa atalanta]|uniref:actin depolymerising venom protein gelsolin 1-like n=1 Tax=Vanessa atalanta TaxID=42275 RepID=UPI001FCD1636|nr:actin depolymerising venom protein gelsolin 1-like [Vanessa atalanta]